MIFCFQNSYSKKKENKNQKINKINKFRLKTASPVKDLYDFFLLAFTNNLVLSICSWFLLAFYQILKQCLQKNTHLCPLHTAALLQQCLRCLGLPYMMFPMPGILLYTVPLLQQCLRCLGLPYMIFLMPDIPLYTVSLLQQCLRCLGLPYMIFLIMVFLCTQYRCCHGCNNA